MAMVHLTRVQKKVAAALAVGVVLYVYVGGRYSERVAQDNFRVFDQAPVRGVLAKVDIRNHGVGIVLKERPGWLVFYPRTDKRLNQGKHFHLWAEPGDFISKPAYSDTLRLMKGNRVYQYMFQTRLRGTP
jgi:hypothetical protein